MQTKSNNFRFTLENKPVTLGYRKSINISQSKHYHGFYEILYIIDGAREVFAEDRTYSLNRGDLLLIPPEKLHKSLLNSGDSEIYSLYIPAGGALDLLKTTKSVRFSEAPDISDRIGNLLSKMENELREETKFFQSMAEALSIEIEVRLARYLEKQKSMPVELNEIQKKTATIIQYIRENSSEELSLQILADHFYLSPSYLSRVFHRETGFTLINYINHIRVLKAQVLLSDTSIGISSISEMSGFGSITHFGRVFKSIAGMPPGTYRRINSINYPAAQAL